VLPFKKFFMLSSDQLTGLPGGSRARELEHPKADQQKATKITLSKPMKKRTSREGFHQLSDGDRIPKKPRSELYDKENVSMRPVLRHTLP